MWGLRAYRVWWSSVEEAQAPALLALGGAGVGVPAGAMDGPSTAAAAGATTVPQPHELTTEVPHMYDVPQQETGV